MDGADDAPEEDDDDPPPPDEPLLSDGVGMIGSMCTPPWPSTSVPSGLAENLVSGDPDEQAVTRTATAATTRQEVRRMTLSLPRLPVGDPPLPRLAA